MTPSQHKRAQRRARRRAARAHVLLAGVLLAAGCAGGCDRSTPAANAPAQTQAPVPAALPEGPHPMVVMEIEGFGTLRIEVFPELAPRTVENFLELARSGFYDGTTIHRVIPGFIIQGGDPNTRDRDPRNDGQGGPGWTIPDEESGLTHDRGAVAMAKRGANTTGSQFFVVLAPSPELDPFFTVFGRVVEGMDVADRIAAVERDQYGRFGPRDRPLEDVVVAHVRVEEPAANAAAAPNTAGGV